MTSAAVDVAPEQLEPYRRELTAHCYRMLGSGADADDAVQETLVRAWRAADRFEGRSSVRTWLYRIATNVCIDMTRSSQRRARPMDLGPAMPPVEESLAGVLPEGAWVSPIADERVLPLEADPADMLLAREGLRLAFVSALQHLPARQRAVLILFDVVRWQASEIADLLDTTVASVNSMLQRARTTLAKLDVGDAPTPLDADQEALVDRYVDAFERYDMDELVRLLHKDAIQTMPPFAMWLRGPADITAWMLGVGHECRGSRLIRTSANGCPAFGQYRVDPAGGHRPWALQVLEIRGDRIAAMHAHLDTELLFPAFGLPPHLPA